MVSWRCSPGNKQSKGIPDFVLSSCNYFVPRCKHNSFTRSYFSYMFLDEDFLQNKRSSWMTGTFVGQVIVILIVVAIGARLNGVGNVDRRGAAMVVVKARPQSGLIAPTTVALPGSLQKPQSLPIPFPDLSDAPSRLPLDNRLVTASVKSGDSLARVLMRHGGTYQDAAAIAQGLRAAGSSASSLRAGESLELEVSLDGQIVSLRRKLVGGDVLTLKRDKDRFVHSVIKPRIIETEIAISNAILSSLSNSANQAGLPRAVLDEFVDLFGNAIEFNRDIQPGDSFSVIYTKRETDLGDTLSPGPIQAASLMIGGRFVAAIRYVDKSGRVQYYDADGHPLGGSFLRYPVRFSRISSVFSDSRLHPVLKVRRPHNGVDFVASVGTPVRSVADGIVTMAGRRGDAGIMLKVRHCGRYETAYLHLNRIVPGIKKGTRVTRGQHIGDVGRTGLVSGAHLHFSFYDSGRYVDPLKLKPNLYVSDQPKLPPNLLKAKVDALQRYHQVLTVAAVDVGRREAKG